MTPCPSCNSLCTIPIIYGKPGPELERAASQGLAELGGCIIDHGNPDRRCLDCKHSWQDRLRHFDVETFVSDAVVITQKHRDHIAHLVADYGSACIEYGRTIQSRDEDQAGSYSSMLLAHQEIGREWERFFVRAQEFCRQYSPSNSSRIYGSF